MSRCLKVVDKFRNETNETLQNLFNIHSGGGERTLDQQIQTFKALSENASFDQIANGTVGGSDVGSGSGMSQDVPNGAVGTGTGPVVNINLHIHLPENKTRREYENIIEDIGRYIFGKQIGERRD